MAKTLTKISNIISPDGKYLGALTPGFDKRGEDITRLIVFDLVKDKQNEICEMPDRTDEILWLGNKKIICSPRHSNQYIAVSKDGSNLPSIVIPPEYKIIHKRISPDGEKVAFVGSHQTAKENELHGLFLMNLEKGETHCLLENALTNPPSWSSDSSKIAIGNAPGFARDYPLTIIKVESGEILDTGIKGVGTSWSPDNRYLAFTTEITRVSRIWQGVPEDGRIGILDLETDNLTHISPPVSQSYDEEMKKWKYVGSVHPTWSPDANLIIYRKTIRSSFELIPDLPDLIMSEQTWIVDREGKNSRKIVDGFYPFACTHNSRSLYIIRPNQIELLNLESLESQILCSLEKTKPSPRDVRVIKKHGVRVKTTWIDKAYGEAFAAILSEARHEYEALGFSLPRTVTMKAKRDPGGGMGLFYTDGESHIYLRITSKRILTRKANTLNIYGICHELGHIVMYRSLKSYLGLPEGVGEGWAHYAGSVVVDVIAKNLGKAIWPESYDIAELVGIPRLKRDVEGKEWDELDPSYRATKVFYEIEKKHGRQTLTKSLNQALSTRPLGKELMPLFIQSLRKATGDTTAGDWIPQTVMIPQIRWGVKERIVEESFFDDLRIRKDKTGILLSYDHSKPGGKNSLLSDGHTILFKRPENVALDRVDIFGTRFGKSDPPDQEFSIFVCDEDFNLLYESIHPYSLFKLGRNRWYRIPIKPVNVPPRFYICIYFNPKHTQGVYVAIDKTVHHSHSRMALPYTHVNDVKEKYDWMIRAHLTKHSLHNRLTIIRES